MAIHISSFACFLVAIIANYLKRSDHFLGTLKFLHTVSVSSSDSLVIGFRCMFYK